MQQHLTTESSPPLLRRWCPCCGRAHWERAGTTLHVYVCLRMPQAPPAMTAMGQQAASWLGALRGLGRVHCLPACLCPLLGCACSWAQGHRLLVSPCGSVMGSCSQELCVRALFVCVDSSTAPSGSLCHMSRGTLPAAAGRCVPLTPLQTARRVVVCTVLHTRCGLGTATVAVPFAARRDSGVCGVLQVTAHPVVLTSADFAMRNIPCGDSTPSLAPCVPRYIYHHGCQQANMTGGHMAPRDTVLASRPPVSYTVLAVLAMTNTRLGQWGAVHCLQAYVLVGGAAAVHVGSCSARFCSVSQHGAVAVC
jgi:hypothetical protein